MREKIVEYIKTSLENKSLDVFFQLQFAKHNGLDTYSIMGAEALLRPNQTLCNTEYLIHVAETERLTCELGHYIMHKAMHALRDWNVKGLITDTFNLSINVTAKQIESPKFFDEVVRCIRETQVEPHQITLEISEMTVIEDMNIAKIYQLARLGINISLDDFGTGYSSLGRLKLLPITEIKIDKSFVVDITKTEQDIAIITAMYQLTQALNKVCVVEGVETKEQFEILNQIGFECYQGFFFSHPMSAKSIASTLKLVNSLHCR